MIEHATETAAEETSEEGWMPVEDFKLPDEFFEMNGVTREQADEGAVQIHKKGVEAALRAASLFAWEVNAEAYDLKDSGGKDMRLLAVFDADEYYWLKMEYPGCMESKEFIEDYQRLKGQTFLAKPSSDFEVR